MKITILNVPKCKNETVQNIIWSLVCAYGGARDRATLKELRKWAEKMHCKPIPKDEFEREVAESIATYDTNHENPEEGRLEPLTMAVRSAILNGQPATLFEIIKRLKTLRYWRGTGSIFTGNHRSRHSKMKIQFGPDEFQRVISEFINDGTLAFSVNPASNPTHDIMTRFDKGEDLGKLQPECDAVIRKAFKNVKTRDDAQAVFSC